MGLFNTISKEKSDKRVDDAKLVHRLEKGRLEKEIRDKEIINDRLTSKTELLQSKIDDIEKERDYFKGLENDRDAIEREKKFNTTAKADIEDDKKELEHREERMKKRAERLETEENDEYKKGYSDGLADGLRKAHDITREDRKYLTMIAMSTNQSGAIKEAQKALGGGFKDDSADS